MVKRCLQWIGNGAAEVLAVFLDLIGLGRLPGDRSVTSGTKFQQR